MRTGLTAVLAAMLLATTSCGDDDDGVDASSSTPEAAADDRTGADLELPTSEKSAEDYPDGTILRALHEDGRFGVFVALVEQRLGDTFPRFFAAPSWPNTLLAPTDAAFERLEPDVLEAFLTDDALRLTAIRYHVVTDGPIPVEELGGTHYTVAGPVEATEQDGAVLVAGVEVHDTDIEVGGSNEGVIHLVEQVIFPCDDPVVERELDTCTG